MEGYLDQATRRSVSGWARDSDGEPPVLTLRINGGPRLEFTPAFYRGDLVPLCGRGDLGFRIELPSDASPGDVVSVTNAAGEHLTGSPATVSEFDLSRLDKALVRVTRDMAILEIGPSFNPIAPRSEGWRSYSLDHATQAELRAKYAGQQNVNGIEAVDFVWRGGPIDAAVPVEMHGTFDVVIASHVIEHFPDPIGFYLSAAKLLKPDGVISLIVPDKRIDFDFFKPVSLTSDLLTAHVQGRTRHSRKVIFDNAAYNISDEGEIAWSWRAMTRTAFATGENALALAKHGFDTTVEDESASYVDAHHTIYTPSSFALSILELGQLGVIPYKIACEFPTIGAEFYVTLQKGAPQPLPEAELAAERMRLLKAMIREQAEQARWLVGDDEAA